MIGWLLRRGMVGVFVVCFTTTINAQHEGHKMPAPKPTPRATPASAPKKAPERRTTSPTATPAPSPAQTHTQTPQAQPSPATDADATEHSAAMEMGPLLMMHGQTWFRHFLAAGVDRHAHASQAIW
jgi:hypothetical protein